MRYILYDINPNQIEELLKDYRIDKNKYVLMYPKLSESERQDSINIEHQRNKNLKIHMEWLQQWANKKINFHNQTRTIKEVFSYNNQTLFYLIDYFILRKAEIENPVSLEWIMTLIDVFDSEVKEDITLISSSSQDDIFFKVLSKVCKNKKLRFKLKIIKNAHSTRKKPSKKSFATLTSIKLWLHSRCLIGKIRKLFVKKDNQDNEKSSVLIPSSFRFTGKRDIDNVMFGTIIKEFRKDVSYKIINYDLPDKQDIKKSLKFMFNKTGFIGDYYTCKVFKQNKRLFKQFKRIWNDLRKNKGFKQSFVYKEINVYDLLLPRLELIFNALFYLIADNINITRAILEKEKPRIVLMDHDNNFYGKDFMINSKFMSKNIKIQSIALQHEVVYPNCNHTHILDSKALDKNNVFWRPLPTKKCIWAPYHKQVLLKYCNYPEDKIAITGNPKFDDLINKKFNKKEIIKKYDLPRDKKIVLFGTIWDSNIARIILKSFKDLKDTVLVIKPHPFENMDVLNKVYNKYKSENIRLVSRYANPYELLSVTDLLITRTSTIGLEAMIKGIPVLILNPYKERFGRIPYFESNLVLIAKNQKELTLMVNKALHDRKTQQKLKKNMEAFVFNQAYKKDGKATQRVVVEIKKLLN